MLDKIQQQKKKKKKREKLKCISICEEKTMSNGAKLCQMARNYVELSKDIKNKTANS